MAESSTMAAESSSMAPAESSSTTTAESSITSAATKSSNPTPEDQVITIELKPVFKLKESLSALLHMEFNVSARLDITPEGFAITVRNTGTNVIGHLQLEPHMVNKFECRKSITGKLITVSQFYMLLNENAATQDDSVTILLLDGSNFLTLIIGSNPAQHHLELFDMKEQIVEKIPKIKCLCEAVLEPADILREAISRLKNTVKSREVSVDIQKKLVTFYVGRKPFTWTYHPLEDVGTRGISNTVQKHSATFIMHHFEVLQGASFLTEEPVVSFLWEPENHVMMRFPLETIGDVVFIYRATRFVKNSHEVEGSGSREEAEGSGSEDKGSGSHEEEGTGCDFVLARICSKVCGGSRDSEDDSDV